MQKNMGCLLGLTWALRELTHIERRRDPSSPKAHQDDRLEVLKCHSECFGNTPHRLREESKDSSSRSRSAFGLTLVMSNGI